MVTEGVGGEVKIDQNRRLVLFGGIGPKASYPWNLDAGAQYSAFSLSDDDDTDDGTKHMGIGLQLIIARILLDRSGILKSQRHSSVVSVIFRPVASRNAVHV